MDANINDMMRRMEAVERGVTEIHGLVQGIASDLKANEATKQQVRGLTRWLFPDIGVAAAIALAVAAIAMRFVP